MIYSLCFRTLVFIYNIFCSYSFPTAKASSEKQMYHAHTTRPRKLIHVISGAKGVQIFKRSEVQYCLTTYDGHSRKLQISNQNIL